MTTKIERRFFTEIRVDKEGDMPVIRGYAAVFNKYADLGYFREKIEPGAFSDTINVDDIRALVDHDAGRVIGRNKSGTLTMKEDDKGLFVEITPPDTTAGRDIVKLIKRGDVSGMSFGFQTITDEWGKEEGKDVRTLRKVKLYDVSPVTFPAYTDTSVGLRSLEMFRKEHDPIDIKQKELELEQTDNSTAEAVA